MSVAFGDFAQGIFGERVANEAIAFLQGMHADKVKTPATRAACRCSSRLLASLDAAFGWRNAHLVDDKLDLEHAAVVAPMPKASRNSVFCQKELLFERS
jgi:hypothetical protein